MGRQKGSPLNEFRFQLWTLLDEPSSGPVARVVMLVIMATIFTSIINFAMASCPDDWCEYDAITGVRHCSGTRFETHGGTDVIETVCIIIFSVEYVLRIATAGSAMPLYRFVFEPLNLLDLVAILPWYVTFVISTIYPDGEEGAFGPVFSVVRVVRLARILRVLKASKELAMFLVIARTLHRAAAVLALLFFVVSTCMLLFGALIVEFERGVYNPHLRTYVSVDGQTAMFHNILDAMYWCMATMTSVGYGDMYPVTLMGHAVGICAAVGGVIVLSLPLTVIGATFTEEYEEQQRITERQKRLLHHDIQMAEAAAEVAGTVTAEDSGVHRSLLQAYEDSKIPGYVQCEWLLEDFRQSVAGDVRQLMRKGEEDLMRMSRKVIIHSRILASGEARTGEEGPLGGDDPHALSSQWATVRDAHSGHTWDTDDTGGKESRKVRRPH